jgi:hypothetical protein
MISITQREKMISRGTEYVAVVRHHKLDFLFRKETRNLYWNRILTDKMEDSCGDYVFFDREKKTNSPKKFRHFPPSFPSSSPSHHFLAKSPSRANFLVGHLNEVYKTKNFIRPEGRGVELCAVDFAHRSYHVR